MLAEVDESIREHYGIIAEQLAIIDRVVERAKRANIPQNELIARYHDYVDTLIGMKQDLVHKERHRARLHQSMMGVVETYHF